MTPTPPQVIYVNKTVSEIFEGTQEIKKISSESELREILTTSSIFDGGFYDDRSFPTGGFVLEESLELERRSLQHLIL
jgi:hypothetical protein